MSKTTVTTWRCDCCLCSGDEPRQFWSVRAHNEDAKTIAESLTSWVSDPPDAFLHLCDNCVQKFVANKDKEAPK